MTYHHSIRKPSWGPWSSGKLKTLPGTTWAKSAASLPSPAKLSSGAGAWSQPLSSNQAMHANALIFMGERPQQIRRTAAVQLP
ncbi:hypothetical protein PFLmoz3_00728 [Pseudomonas fluorescens]|uniref:Uncharacterized protein n=1 Tax=Pseudomonas fluorescens TaxID=294 RepID=A0A109LKU4_PSEFL|nr:hypothetical protein PFLmoz3_00728 [Pseudomonas fluorescens]